MNPDETPCRTPAGDDEIRTRSSKLPWRLRALLVSITGNKTIAQLAGLFPMTESISDALRFLVEAGLVERGGINLASKKHGASAKVDQLLEARRLLADAVGSPSSVFEKLSAFRFILKLERSYTKEELNALLPEVYQMVSRTRDPQYARVVVDDISALLRAVQ